MQTNLLNRSRCTLTVALFASAAAGNAGAAMRQLALAEPDQFVLRAVSVKLADGKTMGEVLGIASYDAATQTFQLETARSGTVSLPAASIGELTFTQSPKRSSPMVQQCPWDVVATAGQATTLKVVAGKLRIDQGRLALDDAELQSAPAPDAVLEVQRIAYDVSAATFDISLRAWCYEVRRMDCKSGPGQGKGLQ